MEKFFSVGEAAKSVRTTSETLRHYDRIGLVKPSKKDKWTNYRYYTEQDIVRLNTVRALQIMDLPLQEIKKVLEYEDLEKIVDFLAQAEKTADEKIAALQYSKSKIQLAKDGYEKKLQERKDANGTFFKRCQSGSFCFPIRWKPRRLRIFGAISATSMIKLPLP